MRPRLATLFVFFLSFSFPLITNAAPPDNFNEAKKVVSSVFAERPVTLYCGCKYDPATKRVDLNSCNMQSAMGIERARRIEWEHMMPAENFGRQLPCWREAMCTNGAGEYKGRKCCEKLSPEFRHMEAELYNLWPAVGAVNQARSNYRYAQFPRAIFGNSSYHGCPILIDNSLRKVEPRDEAKGIVARANLFMSQKYGIKLSEEQRRLFETWNKEYPPTPWERVWSGKVAAIEGYSNNFIETHQWN